MSVEGKQNYDDAIDLTYLQWSISRYSSGTLGSFLKSYEEDEEGKIYYKMSNFNSQQGVYGHESFNEIVAKNILSILGYDYLDYELLKARVIINGAEYVTWLTKSRDYKRDGEKKIAIENYYEVNCLEGESKVDFLRRVGFAEQFYKILLFDYLIFNRDRHGANVEVLLKRGNARLAPIFDNGLSFLFSTYDETEKIENFNILGTGIVNNWFGHMDVKDNLAFVPKEEIQRVSKLDWDRERVFKDLEQCDAVSEKLKNAIWRMLLDRIEVLGGMV